MFSSLIVTEAPDTVQVRLHRPDSRNAIDITMTAELNTICDLLEAQPRVLILTGGEGVFASGVDIRQLRDRTHLDGLRGSNARLFMRILRLPMPTIAVLDGYAIGGGAELAYACDFRIGSPLARFANPETSLGVIAGAGASWRLAALVGEPTAKEMLFTGRSLDADEALALRLLNRIAAREHLLAVAQEIVGTILQQSPLALRLSKSAFHAPPDAHPLVDELSQALVLDSEEKRKRMDSFLRRSKKRG